MAIKEVSSSSSLSIKFQPSESHRLESRETKPTAGNSAVSLTISENSFRPDIIKSHAENLQKAQSRFEKIDSDKDGSVSRQELIAIRKELNDKGRQTPGLDRAIANFSKLDQNADSDLQLDEIQDDTPPPPPPTDEQQAASTSNVEAPPVEAEQTTAGPDAELAELLKVLSKSGIKGSISFYASKNGSSADVSSEKSTRNAGRSAVDPNTAFASYVTSVLPNGASADALDRVVQSHSVIESDLNGAVSQTLKYYGLKG
jgi:hypothetical protein